MALGLYEVVPKKRKKKMFVVCVEEMKDFVNVYLKMKTSMLMCYANGECIS